MHILHILYYRLLGASFSQLTKSTRAVYLIPVSVSMIPLEMNTHLATARLNPFTTSSTKTIQQHWYCIGHPIAIYNIMHFMITHVYNVRACTCMYIMRMRIIAKMPVVVSSYKHLTMATPNRHTCTACMGTFTIECASIINILYGIYTQIALCLYEQMPSFGVGQSFSFTDNRSLKVRALLTSHYTV